MVSMGKISLRKATESDREDVLEILDEAARWLSGVGVQQWPYPFPRVVVDRDLEHNAVWIAMLDGAAIATASILDADPTFWGDVEANAAYLHRFAVRRRVAGAGREILTLLERELSKSDVEVVRLDCGSGLRAYYEKAGYQLKSQVSLVRAVSSPPRSLWFCFEKLLCSGRAEPRPSSEFTR
jgi:predicted N-acetyltransferase YhbS